MGCTSKQLGGKGMLGGSEQRGRGSFDSVAELERAISRFVEHWNQDAQPLLWTKTARQIRRSIRNAKLISET
jgi:hypothetical protein